MQAMGRQKMVYSAVAVVVLALTLFGVVIALQSARDPYRGLVTRVEVQMDDVTRTVVEQHVAVTRAAIAAGSANGEDPNASDWYNLGLDEYTLGNLVAAREAVEEALNINANFAVAWNTYGNILEQMGDLELAAIAYKQAFTRISSEEFILDYVNFLQQYLPSRKDEARSVLEAAVADGGQRPSFMIALAKWHLADGNCDQALAHYAVARQLEPNNTALQDEYNDVKSQCLAQ